MKRHPRLTIAGPPGKLPARLRGRGPARCRHETEAVLRILLDARTVGREFSGVGNYVLELVRAFRALDVDHEFVLGVHGPSRLRDLEFDGRFRFLEARFSHESHPAGDLWEQYALPRLAADLGADVLHGPAFLIPTRTTAVPKVVTIHDVVAFSHRDTIPLKYAVYMRWLIRRAARHAETVITDSESVRRDLLNLLGTSPDKVHTVPLGVSEGFHPPSAEQRTRSLARIGIQGPYLLSVGNLEPRKNLSGLLRAYRILRNRIPDPPRLVIAGKLAWKSRALRQDLDAEDLRESVVATGYVEPSDLPALYAGAEAFVFPTFWEGFGLPVLEAMACGTAVVASGISSIPEVAGDAAILVDPQSDESIAAGILSVLESPERRADLIRRGRERAARFTWESTARRTLAIYALAAGERP